MSTFGRGIRYELKKVQGNMPASLSTILSVPSSSNYFIFINTINHGGTTGGGAGFQVQHSFYDTTAGESFKITGTVSLFTSYHVQFMDFGSGAGTAAVSTGASTVLIPYSDRIIYPGGRLQATFTPSNNYRILYTEVYFGGQSNY